MLKGSKATVLWVDEVGPHLNNLLVNNMEESMFADSRTYPARTVAGMYQQEQEIAKAEEAGLIVTAVDLNPDTYHPICCECGKPVTGSELWVGKYEVIHPECDE